MDDSNVIRSDEYGVDTHFFFLILRHFKTIFLREKKYFLLYLIDFQFHIQKQNIIRIIQSIKIKHWES